MRKILQGFLIVIMLTPVLTCAMAVCPMQAAKAAAAEKPCHHSSGENKQNNPSKSGPMLVLDCMGIDLFSADNTIDLQLNQQIDTLHFAWVDLTTDYGFLPAHDNAIRGPPGAERISQTQPAIILTTQRFRN